MDKQHVPAFLDKLLAQTGGWYLLVIQILAQLLSFVAASIGVFYILLNVEFTTEQTNQLIGIVFILVTGANIIQLFYMYGNSKAARKRLYSWSKGIAVTANQELQMQAWKEISRYPWTFGIAAVVIATFETILPAAVYMYFVAETTVDQAIHVAIGGFLSASILVIMCVIFIEYGLINARLVLLPESPELQKAGLGGTKLQTRLYVLVISSVGIALLMVAPRAYQVAVDAISGKAISLYVLQWQLITVATVAVVVSTIFAALIARIIYRPIAHLVDVMTEIEMGNLHQRADILATDEVALATIQFNIMLERFENLQRRMDEEVQKRTIDLERKTAQLQAAAQVARESAAIQDVYELLSRVVNLISEQFGYYHAGIFISDAAEQYVVLQAASSEGGAKMVARGHRLRIGGEGIVGMAAASRRPRIALDVGEDAVYFSNLELPETHSEIALPLLARGTLIGVLDIQSKETLAFSQDDFVVLQTMADQIALAIEHARLLSESQQAIAQLQANTSDTIRSSWHDYLSRQQHAFLFTPFGVRPTPKEPAPKDLEKESEQLDVPITLRGQTIGRIVVNRPGLKEKWSESERGLTNEIATQIGLAVENARLILEQQRLAQRERQINIITGEIRKSTKTETILQNTVRELGKALGATRAFIQFGTQQESNLPAQTDNRTVDTSQTRRKQRAT